MKTSAVDRRSCAFRLAPRQVSPVVPVARPSAGGGRCGFSPIARCACKNNAAQPFVTVANESAKW